ncbi:MAG: MATE family efflux transporter [Eubacteriales bacterium]|nr:MATE family efflux transporter [Eubacteriales bacterium]
MGRKGLIRKGQTDGICIMEMREGNLWKKILLYSLPLMFTNMLQLLFNTADVAIVGKFAGSLSLGAVGSTSLLISLTTGVLIGVSAGVNSVVAFFIGADEKEKEQKAGDTGFVICLVLGCLVLAIGVLLARPILSMLGTKDELIEEAILYFRIYMLGSPALAVFNYGNAILSAEGNTKEPLKYLVLSGVINVIFNLIFVLGFGMAAEGVALASIIAQYISAILVMRAIIRSEESYRFDFRNLKLDGRIAARVLKIGIPAAMQYALYAVSNLFVQSAVNTFDHVVVEGNSAAMNIDLLVYDMMAAFYTACTSFIAQNYGANKKDRVLKSYLVTTVYSFGLAVILGFFVYVFRYRLLYIFTNDPEVVAKGAIRTTVLSVSYCISAFMDNSSFASRGLGKTVIPTIIIMMGTIVFRIVWVYTIFAYFHTLTSLYLVYGCAFAVTGLAGNIYFFREFRRIRFQ